VAASDLELAKMNYDVATANYEQAKASLDQANTLVVKTTINAPMDGMVSALNVVLGVRVLGTSQFQGTDVMTVADLSRMEARINVSENDVVNIQNGDTARIVVDAFPDRKYIGIVYQIANTATTTGAGTQEEVTNFEVRMRIKDEKSTLRPGMSMTATVETQTKQNVLTVPIQSVTARSANGASGMGSSGTQQGDQSSSQSESDEMAKSDTRIKQVVQKTREIVFVIDNGVAKEIDVKRGIADDQYVEIVSGSLPEGKEVVSGSYKAINRELDDNVKVKIDNAKKPAGDKKETT
jgi:HlyD family secretion protein